MTNVLHRARVPVETDRLAVDTLRFLAADMVQSASSGHPGMPMGAAPMAWTLWSRHLRHDPEAPDWADRDRFVLSAGHGSALLYGLLHTFGYDLPEAELRSFRQLGSRTPGHPEFGHTPGVECTTGPLGQGLAMSVGMALAERMANARYPEVTGHHTYAIVGDGCLMEGISHEAASLAGHLGLGRLIVLWDDNDITIDGGVDRSCSDDQLTRFGSYGWHTEAVVDGTDIDAIDQAITRAKADPRPSFIAVRTVIGQGAPGVEGTAKAHGSPLGDALLAETKKLAGWEHPPFTVPEPVRAVCSSLAETGAQEHAAWREEFAAFEAASPERAAEYSRAQERRLPDDLTPLLQVADTAPRATRQSSQACLDAARAVLPELVGGSADLSGSTGTAFGELVTRGDYSGTAIAFGIREFGMAAIMNGISLHGGFRVFGSTFLVFADYLRPALRLSALMGQPVIYVLTHDSIAVGEDGPTHQPVEHVESLRAIPGLQVLRPADTAETVEAWRLALKRTDGPTALILSRQSLPQLDPDDLDVDQLVSLEIVATGSEVSLATAVARVLRAEGYGVRVVSALDRSRYAPDPSVTTVSLEAGNTASWRGLVDLAIGIDDFGDSGPGGEVMAHHGFTADAVAARVRDYLGSAR
ncbi:transketolase [Saccharopolyspora mangrovi]|uniref:Transketolase n=1 Tax=Saccharopolyspora mangrovi TaxID=3082379 RepID=A0ABU6A5L1_9PSEU|nr:transketolase [Saccharopolyspora sp. S2-29]MEB3366659.1 transketolase [Saccharopolyspora sp. S2-29]